MSVAKVQVSQFLVLGGIRWRPFIVGISWECEVPRFHSVLQLPLHTLELFLLFLFHTGEGDGGGVSRVYHGSAILRLRVLAVLLKLYRVNLVGRDSGPRVNLCTMMMMVVPSYRCLSIRA